MKYKGFVCGVIIGAIGMTTVGVTAADNIANAIINEAVTFDFGNNIKKALALNYNDSLYVPARFVAEGLGAEVNWNEAENTVKITPKEVTTQPTTIQPTTIQETTIQETAAEKETETTTKKQETTAKKETWKDTTSYETLPIRLNYPEMNISATLLQWDREATKLYVTLENRGSEPLNLQQIDTVMTIKHKDGDKKYYAKDAPTNQLSSQWFNDVTDTRSSYVTLPPLPEGTNNLIIEVKVLVNSYGQRTITVPFKIDLDL